MSIKLKSVSAENIKNSHLPTDFRFGHNEIDEPMFTQPIMYSIIKKHQNVLDIYGKKLMESGVVTKEELDATVDKYERICEDAYKKAGEETQVSVH